MKSTEYNSGYPDRTMWINLAAKQDALERSAKKQLLAETCKYTDYQYIYNEGNYALITK